MEVSVARRAVVAVTLADKSSGSLEDASLYADMSRYSSEFLRRDNEWEKRETFAGLVAALRALLVVVCGGSDGATRMEVWDAAAGQDLVPLGHCYRWVCHARTCAAWSLVLGFLLFACVCVCVLWAHSLSVGGDC